MSGKAELRLGIDFGFQNITFGGNGIYSVDLSKLVKDNIELQANVKRILVKIPEPIIKSVNIDEQKTIYETKLTPAENQVMIKNAKEKMKLMKVMKLLLNFKNKYEL